MVKQILAAAAAVAMLAVMIPVVSGDAASGCVSEVATVTAQRVDHGMVSALQAPVTAGGRVEIGITVTNRNRYITWVSTDRGYSFTVTRGRDVVARFRLGHLPMPTTDAGMDPAPQYGSELREGVYVIHERHLVQPNAELSVAVHVIPSSPVCLTKGAPSRGVGPLRAADERESEPPTD
jgi:hypothetical protein